MEEFDTFLAGRVIASSSSPTPALEERVAALELENVALKDRLKKVEDGNAKLVEVVKKLITSPQQRTEVKSEPRPQQASAQPWIWTGSSQALPAVVQSSAKVVSSPITKKRPHGEDPLTLDRDKLGLMIAGKAFPAEFEQHLNSVKKNLIVDDMPSGPLELARKLCSFAKETIAGFVPQGQDAFDYECRYIHAIYHKAKKLKTVDSKDEGEVDVKEVTDLETDMEVLAEALPREPAAATSATAATPSTSSKPRSWKELPLKDMGITPADGVDQMNSETLLSLAKKTTLDPEQALAVVSKLKETKTVGWSPMLKRDQYLFMSFVLANDIEISYAEAAARLLKVLTIIPVHAAFAASSTDALLTTLGGIKGASLDEKLQTLLQKEDIRKKNASVVLALFELAGERLAAVAGITLKPQTLSNATITPAIDARLMAPTKSLPEEKLLHLLMASTVDDVLISLRDIAVHILGAVFKIKGSTVLNEVCPDGKIPTTLKAAALMTF